MHTLYGSPEGAALIRPFAPEATQHGKVDRAILARLVTESPDLLTRLEPEIHGEIRRRAEAFLAQARNNREKLALLDVPLLFEGAMIRMVDKSIVVTAPADIQRQRAMARPGMTAERFKLIHGRQMPDAEKRKRADYLLINDKDLVHLEKITLELIAKLRMETAS